MAQFGEPKVTLSCAGHYKMIAAVWYSLRVAAAPRPCCTMHVDCMTGTTTAPSKSLDVLTQFATTLNLIISGTYRGSTSPLGHRSDTSAS
jgi:hypothetical protein